MEALFLELENFTPIIVIGIYCLVEVLKKFVLKTDEQRSMIPVGCAILGGICGFVLFKFFPESYNEDANVISVITSGSISGIAATGTNQIYKKIKNYIKGKFSE